METLVTERLNLRKFDKNDWKDLLEVAIDWKTAPGPEFDKWPITENECKGFVDYLAGQENFFAIYLCSEKKVIGLIALNGVNENGQMDVGHVILSKYQNNNIDKEALHTIINNIFETTEIRKIITGNFPDEKQLKPLISLGFDKGEKDGILIIDKEKWKERNKKMSKK